MTPLGGGDWLAVVDPAQVKPGLLGFAVVMATALALVVLLRSLSKHLRRVDVDREAREGLPQEDQAPDNPNGRLG